MCCTEVYAHSAIHVALPNYNTIAVLTTPSTAATTKPTKSMKGIQAHKGINILQVGMSHLWHVWNAIISSTASPATHALKMCTHCSASDKMDLWTVSSVTSQRGSIASLPGHRRNGLATSASSNCYFHCLKVGSTNQISERSHMIRVKPNCVMH